MHPPPFSPDHLLSDWPECHLEIRCGCGRSTHYPTKLLRRRSGNHPFRAILPKLRCEACRGCPSPVYLCAGHRTHCSGGPPGWTIELVAEPKA